MKNKRSVLRIVIFLALLILALAPAPVGATPPQEMHIQMELGPEFANPLWGSWSGSIAGVAVEGEAVQYWSHSGNPQKYLVSHTENILVSENGMLTIRSNACLTTTYLEDGFAQTGSGTFTIISGSGVYANLHGQGQAEVKVRYYSRTDQLYVTMDFQGGSHFDP